MNTPTDPSSTDPSSTGPSSTGPSSSEDPLGDNGTQQVRSMLKGMAARVHPQLPCADRISATASRRRTRARIAGATATVAMITFAGLGIAPLINGPSTTSTLYAHHPPAGNNEQLTPQATTASSISKLELELDEPGQEAAGGNPAAENSPPTSPSQQHPQQDTRTTAANIPSPAHEPTSAPQRLPSATSSAGYATETVSEPSGQERQQRPTPPPPASSISPQPSTTAGRLPAGFDLPHQGKPGWLEAPWSLTSPTCMADPLTSSNALDQRSLTTSAEEHQERETALLFADADQAQAFVSALRTTSVCGVQKTPGIPGGTHSIEQSLEGPWDSGAVWVTSFWQEKNSDGSLLYGVAGQYTLVARVDAAVVLVEGFGEWGNPPEPNPVAMAHYQPRLTAMANSLRTA